MRLLLDTHILIWFLSGDSSLPASYRQAIADPNNEVFLSVASVWESVIKFQLRKLTFPQSPEIFLLAERQNHNVSSPSIDEDTVNHLAQLPALHSDPFDRIILAQAIQHQFIVLTVDRQMLAYSVPVLSA